MHQIVYPQITTFLVRAVPIFLAIYYGTALVDSLLNNVPETVTSIITVLGGLLPALGIAMLMNILIKEKIQLILFFAGFVLIAFININMIGLVFLAVLIAYITFMISGKGSNVAAAGNVNMDSDVYEDEDLFD